MISKNNVKRSYFSLPEKLALIVLYFALLIGSAVAAYKFNQLNETRLFEQASNDVVRNVGEGIGKIQTVMASTVALHYMSQNAEASNFSDVIGELRSYSPYITSMGRFSLVDKADRQSFETTMAQQGIYQFAITDATGNSTSLNAENQRYYPIVLLEPNQPDLLRTLGLDIGSIQNVAPLLAPMFDNATAIATKLPENWSTSGNLLILNPTYNGTYKPGNIADRQAHANGGYWMALDLAALLTKAVGASGEFDINLSVYNEPSNNIRIVETQQIEDDNAAWLPIFEESWSTQRQWLIGASRLRLEIKKQPGMQPFVELAIKVISLLGSVVYLLFIAIIYEKRVAAVTNNENLQTILAEREKAEKTLNAISESVVTLDSNLRIMHMNPAAEKLLGAKRREVINYSVQNFLDFSMADNSKKQFDLDKALHSLKLDQKLEFDLQINGDTSTDNIIELALSHTYDKNKNVIGYLIVIRDVSSERKLTRALEYQANHDPLTGVPNRFYFEARLIELLTDTKISGRRHALCYIDLDQFKLVNDTCGHAAGDRLLCELTENLKSIVRKGDVFARLGGDEFGLVIVDANINDAQQIAEKIYDFFQSYVFQHEDTAFSVRASIGFVPINEHSGELSDVLAAADIACYTAKDGGRNSMNIYSEDDEKMVNRYKEMSWLPRLQSALQNDNFELLVQAVTPIGKAALQHNVQHYEFLLRLVDTDGQLITPFHFIPAAERYDIMPDIDRWVIENAIKSVSELPATLSRDTSFSINLSGQSVTDASLLTFIKSKLEQYAVSPNQLWFELTETAAITHFATARDFMEQIRQLGAKVALDDFGSGLSSFGYLKNFPIDVLKIDGQFVKELATNSVDVEMVRSIDNIGKAMNIVTVAEFVESAEIVEVLTAIGVDYAQGYYIGKPCSIQSAFELDEQSKAA